MKKDPSPAVVVLIAALLVGGAATWRSVVANRATNAAVPLARVMPPGRLGTSRPATVAERRAAIASIAAQLHAFSKDDFKTAIFYQSTNLRKRFPNPMQFGSMMHRSYSQFVRTRSVIYGAARTDPGGCRLMIPVQVTGTDGVTKRVMYMMYREKTIYLVDGVMDRFGPHPPPPGVAA